MASEPNGIAYDDKGWHDAGLSVHFAWEEFCAARTPIEYASAVDKLHNAMTDLATWLPGYDYGFGEVTDPRGTD